MTRDDDLRDRLHEAVSDIYPAPALERIRRRTQPAAGVRRVRPWLGVTTAAAAVAVIVGGIALVNRPATPPAKVGPAAASPGEKTSPTAATGLTPRPAGPGPVERTLGIYYVGDTPQGPRLYREFQRVMVPPQGPPVADAVAQALQPAEDPDYRTAWPRGTRLDQDQVSPSGNVAISLSNAATDLRTRPAGMSEAEATAAVQQLVHTVQGVVQNRNPVRFQLGGKPVDTLLGVDVAAPVDALGQLDALALVSITDPAEGANVRGSFVARGVASSFEANVPWQITSAGRVVKSGYSTAGGWVDRLYPWQTDPIDVSDLAPGRYTFVATTDDPSAGEGSGPMKDTRTIVVRR